MSSTEKPANKKRNKHNDSKIIEETKKQTIDQSFKNKKMNNVS